MDFSDIIFYIVLFIIGIISTSIQNNAKKKAEEIERRKQQSGAGNTDSTGQPTDVYATPDDKYYTEEDDDFEEAVPHKSGDVVVTLDDIFRALRQGTPLTPTPAPVQARPMQPTTAPTQPSTPSHTVEPRGMIEEGISVTKNDISNSEISDKNIYDETSTFDLKNIDWKQAVITSEILKRKY